MIDGRGPRGPEKGVQTLNIETQTQHNGRWLLILSLAALILTGCGYTLAGKGNNIPEDIVNVYIQPLENSTSRSQVEQILTQSLSDEMVTRRRFNIVNSAADADALLRGNVLAFEVRPLTFGSDGLANSFEITITADMRFERPAAAGEEDGEVVWENARYLFREDYPLEEEGVGYFDRENIAIEDTSLRFAETLVTDLLEGF